MFWVYYLYMNVCTHITCFFKFDVPTIIVCIPTLLDFTLLTLLVSEIFLSMHATFIFFILNFCIQLVTILQFIHSPFIEHIDCSLFSVIINHTINTFENVYYCICTEDSPGYILNCEMLVLEYLHFKLHRIFPNHSPRCVFLSICVQRKSVWVSETIK